MGSMTIQASDGSGSFEAYVVEPKDKPAGAVVLIQEIFGVNQAMRDIAAWVADLGFIAVCPDLFWRIEPGIDITDKTEAEWKRAFELFQAFDQDKGIGEIAFNSAIAQIIALDLVFSIDSILTAVGMTDEVPIMIAAVTITVGLMLVAADPLAKFIEKNPTLVMLALAFLVMIGLVLIADGLGFHVPKGYVYAAMGFSVGVEGLNMIKRNRRRKLAHAAGGHGK